MSYPLSRLRPFAAVLALSAVFFFAPISKDALAASCIKGVTCYCDKVQGGSLNDPQLLLCEDFEAPTLHDDVGFGNGAPFYGPPYDHSGNIGGFRGQNSYFQRKFGAGMGSCSWGLGQPVSPQRGITCSAGQSCAVGIWRADNLWDANNFACIFIPRNGEFGQEVSALAPGPSNTSSGVNGVFDGQQNFAYRFCAGAGCDAGFVGFMPMAGGTTGGTFGVTMAVAYAANTASAGIWNSQWKHEEWLTVANNAYGGQEFSDFIMAHRGTSLSDTDPFQPLIAWAQGYTLADCQNAVAAATVRKGSLQCESAAGVYYMYYLPDTTAYRRSRDWPLGAWGCVQAYLQNLGSTRATIQISFNGATIIDFDIDPRPFSWKQGYASMGLNGYANINYGGAQQSYTTETTYRYLDNVHVRAGAPVSCSQIGFASSGTTPPPPPPAYASFYPAFSPYASFYPSFSPSTPPPPASTKFAINDRVQVTTGALNVRSTPSTSGTLLGSQPVGALGTVIGGPTASGGFNWWNINYDTSPDGWSVEDNLSKVTSTPPPPPSGPISVDSTWRSPRVAG